MSAVLFVTLCVILAELLSSITGFVHWQKLRFTYWKWFPVYLLIIAISESVAVYISWALRKPELNVSLYTYFVLPIQFLFYCWLFRKYFESSRDRIWPMIGAVLYCLSWISEKLVLNMQGTRFPSLSFTIGNMIILILIIIFFTRLANSDRILSYKKSMMFWVALGLFILPLTFPFYALRNTLYADYKGLFFPLWYTTQGLICLMYILFINGFVWAKPN